MGRQKVVREEVTKPWLALHVAGPKMRSRDNPNSVAQCLRKIADQASKSYVEVSTDSNSQMKRVISTVQIDDEKSFHRSGSTRGRHATDNMQFTVGMDYNRFMSTALEKAYQASAEVKQTLHDPRTAVERRTAWVPKVEALLSHQTQASPAPASQARDVDPVQALLLSRNRSMARSLSQLGYKIRNAAANKSAAADDTHSESLPSISARTTPAQSAGVSRATEPAKSGAVRFCKPGTVLEHADLKKSVQGQSEKLGVREDPLAIRLEAFEEQLLSRRAAELGSRRSMRKFRTGQRSLMRQSLASSWRDDGDGNAGKETPTVKVPSEEHLMAVSPVVALAMLRECEGQLLEKLMAGVENWAERSRLIGQPGLTLFRTSKYVESAFQLMVRKERLLDQMNELRSREAYMFGSFSKYLEVLQAAVAQQTAVMMLRKKKIESSELASRWHLTKMELNNGQDA